MPAPWPPRRSSELAELSLAFHRVSRSVRQTRALELKIDAARRAAEREAARGEAERALARHRGHKDRVRSRVRRLIWTEMEGHEDDAGELLMELEERLGDEGASPKASRTSRSRPSSPASRPT